MLIALMIFLILLSVLNLALLLWTTGVVTLIFDMLKTEGKHGDRERCENRNR